LAAERLDATPLPRVSFLTSKRRFTVGLKLSVAVYPFYMEYFDVTIALDVVMADIALLVGLNKNHHF